MALLEEPIKEVNILKNYINGEWLKSKGEIIDVVNPVNCETIARVPISTGEEMDAANEETIIHFYKEAAEQSKSLMADVPRNFVLVAKKREKRVTELKSIAGSETGS